MTRLLVACLAVLPLLPLNQAKGEWHAAQQQAWEYIADGKVYAHFEGFAADPGEPVARVVSFDAAGDPSEVTTVVYLGMDNSGVTLSRQSWEPTAANKAAFRTRLAPLQPQVDARSIAIEATLGAPNTRLDRVDIRLPPPPVFYRLQVLGVFTANAQITNSEDPRSHLRMGIRVLRDTTIIAELNP